MGRCPTRDSVGFGFEAGRKNEHAPQGRVGVGVEPRL